MEWERERRERVRERREEVARGEAPEGGDRSYEFETDRWFGGATRGADTHGWYEIWW